VRQKEIQSFREAIHAWYRDNARDLPWRRTPEPYHVLVSEIMLQQTQVGRVLEKYPAFLEAFPSPAALHGAPLADVMRLWQGMGYNRRALALKKIAGAIVEEHGGEVPRDVEALQKLPGIGRATASAIAAFAFRAPAVFIETNIRRVFIHFFFAGREGVRDEELLPLVSAALDKERPDVWYSALMDYGTMLKGEVPDPNRRSARYRKQAPFEGSNRQLRGAILRLLLAEPAIDADGLAARAGQSGERVRACLARLAAERLVRETPGGYAL